MNKMSYTPLFGIPQRLALENEYNIFDEEVFSGLPCTFEASFML